MRARRFPKGTRVVTRTGGGGGYGNPLARPEAEVLADVASGLVSREKAFETYGVAVTEALTIDPARTKPRAEDHSPAAGSDA